MPYPFQRKTRIKFKKKVFNQIGLDQIKTDGDLYILIRFLDSILLKEEFQAIPGVCLKNFRGPIDKVSQNIFPHLNSKLEKLDMKLALQILAPKLLRKANISKEENMLVLTGLNYANKEQIMRRQKASL